MLVDGLIRDKREQEHHFAACAFADPQECLRNFGYLKPANFHDRDIAKFWEALVQNGGDALKAANETHTAAGLMGDVLNTFTVRPEVYVEEMEKLAAQIRIYEAITEIAKALSARDTILATTIMADTLKQVVDQSPVGGSLDSVDVALNFLARINQGWNGISIGFPEIENITGPLQFTNISILASRTSVGKTALAWQIARNSALKKQRTLYFSNEMTATDLWMRAACGAAGIDVRRVISGQASDAEVEQVTEASDRLMNAYQDLLYVNDRRSITLEDMHREIARLRPQLVIVDHLDELPMPENYDSKVNWLGDAFTYLRSLAQQYDCHIMVIHQLSRGVEARADHRPILADLRWSGDLEQKADYIFMLHREDLYDPKQAGQVVPVEFWVRKNRTGARDALVGLKYNLLRQWFTDKVGP